MKLPIHHLGLPRCQLSYHDSAKAWRSILFCHSARALANAVCVPLQASARAGYRRCTRSCTSWSRRRR